MICPTKKCFSEAVLISAFGACLLTGCGSSFIILEIDAGLSIPDEADSLHITTLDAKNPTDTALADVDLPLDAGDEFPVEVLLEPSDSTPSRLRQRVTARLGGVAVLRIEVEHEWEANLTNRAKIDLGD